MERCIWIWVENDKGMGGIGLLLAEKWVEEIFAVKRISDTIMLIKLVVGKSIVAVLSVYAPQTGLDGSVKDLFYENPQWTLTQISASVILFVCGDFNGTMERMQMDMRELMVVGDLEDII